MNVIILIYAFLLFFVLTPGVLLTLPPNGSKLVVATTHAALFVLIWIVTHKVVKRATSNIQILRR